MEYLNSRGWRKSSYSGNGGADCVEVGAHAHDGRVLIRDTRDRQGAVLAFSPQDWRRFADQVKKASGGVGLFRVMGRLARGPATHVPGNLAVPDR